MDFNSSETFNCWLSLLPTLVHTAFAYKFAYKFSLQYFYTHWSEQFDLNI